MKKVFLVLSIILFLINYQFIIAQFTENDIVWKIPADSIVFSITSLKFSLDGNKIVVGTEAGTEDNRLYVIDVKSGLIEKRISNFSTSNIADIEFSPDGKYLALHDQGIIQIYDYDSMVKIKELKHSAGLSNIEFTDDGKHIITCFDKYVRDDYFDDSSYISIWDIENEEIIIQKDKQGYIGFIELANNDDFLVIGCSLPQKESDPIHYIKILDAKTLEDITILGIIKSHFNDLEISPDNNWLAAANYNGKVYIWNLKNLKISYTFNVEYSARSIKFSNDSRYIIISGGFESKFITEIWDLKNNTKIYTYPFRAMGIDISPNSKYFALSYGNTLYLLKAYWEPTSINNMNLKVGSNLNYPNPFESITNITFTLQHSGYTSVKIIDNNGNIISKLIEQYLESGDHNVQWNSTTNLSGIYYCQINCGVSSQTIKIVLSH